MKNNWNCHRLCHLLAQITKKTNNVEIDKLHFWTTRSFMSQLKQNIKYLLILNFWSKSSFQWIFIIDWPDMASCTIKKYFLKYNEENRFPPIMGIFFIFRQRKCDLISESNEAADGWVDPVCRMLLSASCHESFLKQRRMDLLFTSYLLHILGIVKTRGTSKQCKCSSSLLQHLKRKTRKRKLKTFSESCSDNLLWRKWKYRCKM